MSYFLINDTFDINKLIFADKICTDDNMSRYYLYYEDNDSKEIYIKLPKLRMIFNNFINQKYSSINIPIYPIWERTEKCINLIHEIETKIQDIFNTKYKFHSLISEKNGLVLFKMKMKDIPLITSTLNKNVTFNDFKINSEIELVVKISYIWLSKKTKKYGLSCQLCQIKYNGLPEQQNIDFIDEKPIKKIHVHESESNKNINSINNINNIQNRPKMPNPDELLAALKKLNKVKLIYSK